MVANPDTKDDSFAVGVWGALEEYDWTDLVPAETLPGQGVEKLYDGKLNPTCAWKWTGTPIAVDIRFDAEREVGGLRWWSGRSWISKGVRKARVYALRGEDDGYAFLGAYEFRPAHTFKDEFATWTPVKCRGVRMVIDDCSPRVAANFAAAR